MGNLGLDVKSLRIINLLFLIITLTLLTIYSLYFHESYYFHNDVVGIIVILLITLVFLSSFINWFGLYYTNLFYVVMCSLTVFTMDTAYIYKHIFLFPLHIIMLLLCVFSIRSKRVMRIFIASYIILTLPFVFFSGIGIEKIIVQLLTMLVVLILGYIKIQHDQQIFSLFEESKKENDSILENAKESFALHEMIFDENNKPIDYKFLKINKAFENYTGLKKNEIIGKTTMEIFPNTEKYWIDFFSEVVFEKKQNQLLSYSSEFKKYYDVSAYYIKGNKFAALFTDVTEKINQERKLKDAIKRTEKAYKLKNQFLKDVNHRLRTPLNGMMGMLQLIDMDEMGKDNQELFEGMLIEMKHSRNIINQIAKYVEIQGMKFTYTYHKIPELINSEIKKLQQNDCQFIFNLSEKCENQDVCLEKNVFTKVFREILLNAVNHTRNRRIEININVEHNKSDLNHYCTVEVVDFGMGIASEKFQYFFNEFNHHDFINIYKDEDKTSIPMCKQMLMGCGGDLKAETTLGKGTRLKIILPITY